MRRTYTYVYVIITSQVRISFPLTHGTFSHLELSYVTCITTINIDGDSLIFSYYTTHMGI